MPISSAVLSTVVEEADAVILVLNRLDDTVDELVEVVQHLCDVVRDVEVHPSDGGALGWSEPALLCRGLQPLIPFCCEAERLSSRLQAKRLVVIDY